MIRTVRDITLAIYEGRSHSQRFFKNASVIGDGQWIDWSFASGQPSYDARIGTALEFTPFVAQGNDAIYFPPAPGMDRRLLGVDVVTSASGASQTHVEFQMYDLLGVYPLIDGDNTDTQPLDNTATLPRYSTGEGVRAVLVNHVAPVVAAANMTVEYTNSQGVSRTVTWRANTNGVNKVSYAASAASASNALFCNLDAQDTGIRSVDSVTFASPAGGLWAIYLVKPIAYFRKDGNALAGVGGTTEVEFALKQAWRLPKIEDGATLGFFIMPNGGSRTVAMHGQAHFIWG